MVFSIFYDAVYFNCQYFTLKGSIGRTLGPQKPVIYKFLKIFNYKTDFSFVG